MDIEEYFQFIMLFCFEDDITLISLLLFICFGTEKSVLTIDDIETFFNLLGLEKGSVNTFETFYASSLTKDQKNAYLSETFINSLIINTEFNGPIKEIKNCINEQIINDEIKETITVRCRYNRSNDQGFLIYNESCTKALKRRILNIPEPLHSDYNVAVTELPAVREQILNLFELKYTKTKKSGHHSSTVSSTDYNASYVSSLSKLSFAPANKSMKASANLNGNASFKMGKSKIVPVYPSPKPEKTNNC